MVLVGFLVVSVGGNRLGLDLLFIGVYSVVILALRFCEHSKCMLSCFASHAFSLPRILWLLALLFRCACSRP